MRLFATNTHVVYLAILHALGLEKVRIPAFSPTFFASGAKLLGKEVELVDCKLDMSAGADIVHNFFETHIPKARVVFQGLGESVGEAEVFVKKYGNCLMIECEEEIGKKIALFLDGGVQRGRLWNYDLVSVGIKSRGEPCETDEELLAKQSEVVEFFKEAFSKNIYFDTLQVGRKTLKSGYPILLKSSLYCPKEDIYQELKKRGVDVQVRFKPLYKTTLCAGNSLPVTEELYKAILILPLQKEVVEPLFEVLERYRHRGCMF
jgi:hypothetical protein